VIARIALALALVALVGCTSKNSSEIDRLRLRAGLDRCPATQRQTTAKLPHVVLSCLGNGPRVNFAGLLGTPTLINVWGSWCLPCQEEVPALQALHVAAADKLRVLGVDTEDEHGSALDFAAHIGMKYPSVVDDNGTFLRSFGKSATPMTLFVDAAGVVVHTKLGPFKDTELTQDVQRYLGVAT
jgi:cytochrome c biogenesis protein CcmG/thiol:disulfide interchange protein DsbE